MLTLITGRGKAGKTRMLLEAVKACPSRAMASRVLIVPEQLSHETERLLSELCGDAISFSAEVLSFTRLYSRVTAISGGGARQTLDAGGRILTARLALESIRPQLKVFAAAAGRGEFLSGMVTLVDELKSYGVTPEALLAVSRETTGLFSEKLRELSLLLGAYEAVTAQGAADPRDHLTLLRRRILEGDYARGRQFFVDGFTDFSLQELGVLEALLRRGAEMTVTVPSGEPGNTEELFSPGRETLHALKAMGERLGIAVAVRPAEFHRPLPLSLSCLERNLFAFGETPCPAEDGAIRLFPAETPLEECRICGAVLKQFAMGGMRCRDMAVCCTDEASYGPLAVSVLSGLGLPVYRNEKRQVLAHPAAKCLLLAIECCTGGMEQEAVLAYLKSGYAPLTGDELDALENYIITWGIRGGKFEKPWTMHPDGYDGKFTEETEEYLAALTALRDRALRPLKRLSQGLKAAANGEAQVLAIYRFLTDQGLYEALEAEAKRETAAGQLESAQETAQIWSILLGCLQQLYTVLGAVSLKNEELLRVLKLALSQYEVGTIPAALDAVQVGTIASIRGKEPKLLFVLGAREGLLPQAPAGGSLLGEQERQVLRERFHITLAPDGEGQIERELLQIYAAFTAPTETLCVSWPAASGGETCQPSYLVSRLALLFPGCKQTAPADTGYTLEAAAEAGLSGGDALRAAIARTADGVPELQTALDSGRAGAKERSMEVSEPVSMALFGTPVALTASRLDKLASCPLSFFLYYGLRARVRKEASFDAAEFGTFVHFIMEKTVPRVAADRAVLDSAESLALVDGEMGAYREARLSHVEETRRQEYLLSRNRMEAAALLRELSQELGKSDFVPCAYELGFGGGGVLPPLTARGRLGDGALSGYVDRADLWKSPEGDFLRVVDYKTGSKKFDYTELLGGVGMQMLLYLFALEKDGIPGTAEKIIPAGVLYFPARKNFVSRDGPEDGPEAPARRSGLVLGEESVLSAMEHGEKPEFLPVRRTKTGLGDYAVSRQQLAALRAFVEGKMAGAVDRILGGEFAPKPFYRGMSHDPCRYCEFESACQKDAQFRKSCYHPPVSAGDFWAAVEGGTRDG